MRKASSATNLIGIIFLAVGLLILGIAAFTTISSVNFRNGAESVMAVITDIDEDHYIRDGESETDYDVYIAYTVDGRMYEKKLNFYDSSMYVGKEIEVFYKPEAPGDARAFSASSSIFLVVSGLIFGGIGAVFVVNNVRNNAKRKKLLESGERVTGTITDITVVTNVRINGRNPYKAVVEVEDYITGEKYLYSSEQVMDDIYYMVGSTVDVYVERDDKSKYYVDLESVNADEYTDAKVHDYR